MFQGAAHAAPAFFLKSYCIYPISIEVMAEILYSRFVHARSFEHRSYRWPDLWHCEQALGDAGGESPWKARKARLWNNPRDVSSKFIREFG